MKYYVRKGSFNPRPRVEGDWVRECINDLLKKFQSTPSRGGRPLHTSADVKPAKVSIHALAWRATIPAGLIDATDFVSIHALAWRATIARLTSR